MQVFHHKTWDLLIHHSWKMQPYTPVQAAQICKGHKALQPKSLPLSG